MIWLKKGIGKSKRAIIKAPLLVLGRILVRSAGVVLLDNNKSKSSEIRSVKLLVLPIGVSERAFLIQKMSIAGQVEKPIKAQPRLILKYSNVMPPKSKTIKMISMNARTGVLFKVRF